MYLKKLEIQGFKSFARKTVLEFGPGIISVVGPNGSGKSNFSDAIRWVLGEQSMKAIRSKKSEDIIFAGSDKKSKLGMAEVSITFDNEDRRLPLDYSEVEIARRVFRDGESEYLLNQRQVRLMDIVDLLAKSGYGNNSYHVISQGTIDQMVIAGPSAIKNLIEEASGVKPYYFKRERAWRKLEKSELNLLRVADLVAEIEPRLRSLKRQARRMEQRQEIENELKTLQLRYFSASYHEIQAALKNLDERIAGYDRQLANLNREAGEGAGRLKDLESGALKKSEEYKILQGDVRKLEREKNRVQEELATIRGELKVKAPGEAGTGHMAKLRQMEAARQLSDIESHLQGFQRQIVLYEKNLADHRKIYEKFDGEIGKIKTSIESAQTPVDIGKLKEDVERVYSRYQSLLYQIKNIQDEQDIKLLQEDAANIEIILVKLKNRIAQVSDLQFSQAELLQLNSQLQKIFSQKERIQQEISKIQVGLNSTLSQQEFYSRRAEELGRELAQAQKKAEGGSSGEGDDRFKELAAREKKLSEELYRYQADLQKMENDLKNFLDQETSQKRELLDLERELRAKGDHLSKLKDQRGMELIERARSEAHLESLFAEIRKSAGGELLERIKNSPLQTAEPGLGPKIQKIKTQLEMIGGVDELVIQEYRETEGRHNYLVGQSNDLKTAVGDLKKVVAELDQIIKRQFGNGFDKINEQFSEYFRVLFSGGRARMYPVKERPRPPEEENNGASGDAKIENAEAEEEEEEQNEEALEATGREEIVGIDIRATPPGKKLATLSALSGGERTLTAIALLMAILNAFPSPFVVLDEVDAALDEANSIRFGKILSRLSHQTQFITITHNRETMRQAGILYGITMTDDGISKVLSIKLDKAVEIAA
jgi:chromosome segregation protein